MWKEKTKSRAYLSASLFGDFIAQSKANEEEGKGKKGESITSLAGSGRTLRVYLCLGQKYRDGGRGDGGERQQQPSSRLRINKK